MDQVLAVSERRLQPIDKNEAQQRMMMNV